MRGAAESETVAEETVPVLTQTTILALRNAISPEIAPACFAMPVVGVAPEPGSQGFVLVRINPPASHSLIGFGLCGEQAIESGDGQFTGIPRMVRADLRIADVCGRQ